MQNVEIHQKKVDILATFRLPGTSREHRVIVECKDEQRAVDANQRVMAFKGLLDVARVAGTADSAEIVTRVPWSDQAKGFARTSDIDIFTYSEKLAQLIDFTTYLKEAIRKFEIVDPQRPSEPPLGAYYVNLSAEVIDNDRAESIPVIDAYIHSWLQGKGPAAQLAIFGQFGSGKSSLCQKLSHDLAVTYLKDAPAGRIPILLNLREFIGKLDIEAYITSFLDRECKVSNPRIDLFRAMNDAGMFLLIFDGFDEMAVKVDADTLESNLMEIEKLAAAPNSKVILTSRPEYFISTREEREALTPMSNPFLAREANYIPLKILSWDTTKVEAFLKKRVPLIKGVAQDWTYYRDKIKGIGGLSDLSKRPVLLEMIVKTLPRLIASGEAINLPSLYKNYILGEMKRQKVLKKRAFLLSDDDRLAILQRIAIDIYINPTPSIAYSDALSLIEKIIKPPKHELEPLTRDLLTNSFLIRRGDEYIFSHKSILEYLVATKLNDEISSNTPELFSRLEFQWEIYNFLRELRPNKETLFAWIQYTKNIRHSTGPLIGGNAASLLCLISRGYLAGKDLSGTDLREGLFRWADLRGTNFKGANVRRAQFADAKFFKEDFSPADAKGVSISYFIYIDNKLRHLSWDERWDKVMDIIGISEVDGSIYGLKSMSAYSSYREDLFAEFVLALSDLNDLEKFREALSDELNTKVAIYFNECEQIAQEADLLKAGRLPT